MPQASGSTRPRAGARWMSRLCWRIGQRAPPTPAAAPENPGRAMRRATSSGAMPAASRCPKDHPPATSWAATRWMRAPVRSEHSVRQRARTAVMATAELVSPAATPRPIVSTEGGATNASISASRRATPALQLATPAPRPTIAHRTAPVCSSQATSTAVTARRPASRVLRPALARRARLATTTRRALAMTLRHAWRIASTGDAAGPVTFVNRRGRDLRAASPPAPPATPGIPARSIQ